MTDLPALIARVRELDAAATKGPWHTEPFCDAPDDSFRNDSDVGCAGIWADDRRDEIVTTDSAVYGPRWADAQLIVYYRTAAPLLAAECERLRERVAELERAASGGRLPGCICTWEEGDSPCPLHGHLSEEAETEARAALEGTK